MSHVAHKISLKHNINHGQTFHFQLSRMLKVYEEEGPEKNGFSINFKSSFHFYSEVKPLQDARVFLHVLLNGFLKEKMVYPKIY